MNFHLPQEINEAEPTIESPVTLTYPHWRAGSLPVTPLPIGTAFCIGIPIKVAFIDEQTQQPISAWIAKTITCHWAAWLVRRKTWSQEASSRSPERKTLVWWRSSSEKRSNKEWIKTVLGCRWRTGFCAVASADISWFQWTHGNRHLRRRRSGWSLEEPTIQVTCSKDRYHANDGRIVQVEQPTACPLCGFICSIERHSKNCTHGSA